MIDEVFYLFSFVFLFQILIHVLPHTEILPSLYISTSQMNNSYLTLHT